MAQDRFKKWLNALRNPSLQQCQGRMADGEARCAFGVYIDVMQADNVRDARMGDFGAIRADMKKEGIEFNWQGPKVYGIDLLYLNDSMGLSLPAIADVLESAYCKHLDDLEGVERERRKAVPTMVVATP